MKRAWVWLALVPLVILGIARPSLDRGVELSSGDYDSNSDCVVRGDELTYHTPDNFIDGLLGGHGRGYETLQFNPKAYRVVFSSGSDEVELVRVRDCGVHLRGEEFTVDGNSVDIAVTSKRGRLVVDRIPDRGRGTARELVVDVPWERKYRIPASDGDLDTFDLAAPLFDAHALVVSGFAAKGQGMSYEVYDYAKARRLHFEIPEAMLPAEVNQTIRIKGVTG
ncbi:hypothetical protein [Lysobacter terrae]